MSERVRLRVDREPEAVERARVCREPALIFPLETTIVRLRAGAVDERLDRATFALLPARTAYTLELPAAGIAVVATLELDPQTRAAAV
ncbi:MAG: hypothetical protein ACM31C_03655, partial [Acidobacteriota bacterium]